MKRSLTDEEIQRQGFEALVDKLGVAGTFRFIGMYYRGSGDYTKERHKWLDGITVDELADRIEKRQAENARKKSRKQPPRTDSRSAPKTKSAVRVSARKISAKH